MTIASTTRTSASPGFIFAVLAVGVSSYSFLQSVSVPTLPLIAKDLGTDQETSTWILTAFLLSASVATPIMGRLGDSIGKRRVLVGSLIVLTIGSLAAAAAPTIELMIAARVLQGLGGGTIPLTFSILRDELPAHRVAGALALTSSLLAAGFAAGTVAAGPIASGLGIHWLFLFPALTSCLAAVSTRWLIPESPRRTGTRVPLFPAVLLAGWLVCLLLGISQATRWGWASPETIGILGSAGLLFGVWIAVERRIDVPLIDLQLMSLRGVWSANLVALMVGMVTFGSMSFMPQLNQTPSANGYGFGVSPTEAGHMMLPSLIATFVCGLVAAQIGARIGVRVTIVVGCMVASIGLMTVVVAHDQPWQMYLASGITGLGTGLVFACLANAVVGAVPPEHTGMATGMNANIRTIGGSIGVAVMTTIVTADPLASGYPTEGAYIAGFAFLAGAALVAAAAGTMLPATRRVTAPVVGVPETV